MPYGCWELDQVPWKSSEYPLVSVVNAHEEPGKRTHVLEESPDWGHLLSSLSLQMTLTGRTGGEVTERLLIDPQLPCTVPESN